MRFIITYMYYVPVPSTLLEGSALKATVKGRTVKGRSRRKLLVPHASN